MKISTILVLAIVMICAARIVPADVLVQSDKSWLEQLNTLHNGVVQAFDGQLGTMTAWEICADNHISGWIDFYNSDTLAHDVTVIVTGCFMLKANVNASYETRGDSSRTISLNLPAYTGGSPSPTSIYIDINQNTDMIKDSPADLISGDGYLPLAYSGIGWIDYTMLDAPIQGVSASLHNWTCTALVSAYYQYNPVAAPEPSALTVLIGGIACYMGAHCKRRRGI